MTTGKAKGVRKLIEKSDDQFLVCRTLGHKFDEGTSAVRRRQGKIFWSMMCGRCGTVRTKILANNGRILGADYSYPKGYSIQGVSRLNAEGLAFLRIHVITGVLGGGR